MPANEEEEESYDPELLMREGILTEDSDWRDVIYWDDCKKVTPATKDGEWVITREGRVSADYKLDKKRFDTWRTRRKQEKQLRSLEAERDAIMEKIEAERERLSKLVL